MPPFTGNNNIRKKGLVPLPLLKGTSEGTKVMMSEKDNSTIMVNTSIAMPLSEIKNPISSDDFQPEKRKKTSTEG